MAFPTGSYDATTYALINGALSAYGYDNMQTFLNTAYFDWFSQVKWTEFYDEAAPSLAGEYKQLRGNKSIPVMASIVAYDGEAPKITTDQITISSGNLPRVKLGFDANEKSMLEMKKMMVNFQAVPNFELLFSQFSMNVGKLLSGIHALITFAGLQILSTGAYTTPPLNNGGGLQGLAFDFGVPAANKLKCGSGAYGTKYDWSSASANPIGDLLDMQAFARLHFMTIGEFCMNDATWIIFKNHATVRAAIAIKMTGGTVLAANYGLYPVTESDVRIYLEGLDLPPINVIKDVATVGVFDTATRTIQKKALRGFVDGVVVARPSGSFGELQWTYPDLSFSTPSNPAYTADGGKISISQITDSKKKSTEFIAEFTGIPVPTQIDFTIYLDTTTATTP